jgi:hypothetical protein
MGDEPALVEHFGRWHFKTNQNQGVSSRFPLARVVTAFNLYSLAHLGYELGHSTSSEPSLLFKLLPALKKSGDILIFDRIYAGANHYALYRQAGFDFIGGVHSCLKVERLKPIRTFGKGDYLVELPIFKKNRLQDPSLPFSVIVRLIQTRIKENGKSKSIWIATSLLDEHRYPAQEIRYWHKQRWKVETLLKEIKILLNANILRSKTVEGISKELSARFLALNLIHWLMLKANQKSPGPIAWDRMSITAAVRLAAAYSIKMSTAPMWQLPQLYEEILQRITCRRNLYRPNRSEPRMIKRNSRRYPCLMTSRSDWRLACAA